jgi:hypothetical protein
VFDDPRRPEMINTYVSMKMTISKYLNTKRTKTPTKTSPTVDYENRTPKGTLHGLFILTLGTSSYFTPDKSLENVTVLAATKAEHNRPTLRHISPDYPYTKRLKHYTRLEISRSTPGNLLGGAYSHNDNKSKLYVNNLHWHTHTIGSTHVYKINKEKHINNLEIKFERVINENDMISKDIRNYKQNNEGLKQDIRKYNDNKTKISKFVNEVISINEALVSKINLLQEKERSRIRDKDSQMKYLMMNKSHNRLESPNKNITSRSTPNKSNNNQLVLDELLVEKSNEKNK